MAVKKSGNGIAVSLGVAAVAAAAAGTYWFYGASDAGRNRKQVKSWMLKARAEALEMVEKLGDVDKKKYAEIVDQIAKRYAGAKGATTAEIAHMTKDLKAAWAHIHAARVALISKAPTVKVVKKASPKAK